MQYQDKVMPLSELIKLHVFPGQVLYVSEKANAAISEIIRQFSNTKPEFTLVMSMVMHYAIDLIHCGLLKKVITTICAKTYPVPGPSPVVQRAYKERAVDIENWTPVSLNQRLAAGAMDVGFMPAKSIVGTSMAQENTDFFKVVDDPFGSGKKLGVVKALNPDIAIIHGWAADSHGNTIIGLSPMYGEATWAALASKSGVVVTVEKLVPTSLISKYCYLVNIPGYLVKAVSVVPFGAHPQGLTNVGMDDFEAYAPDYEFMADHEKASENRESLDAWLQEWIKSCPHEDYFRKLGNDKTSALRTGARQDSWEYNPPSDLDNSCTAEEYTPTEMMIIAAARAISRKVVANGYQALLVGGGAPALTAGVAQHCLRRQGHHIELITGTVYGFASVPGNLSSDTLAISNVRTCKLASDLVHMQGAIVAGQASSCLGILGAGQVDKYGNTNSAKLSSSDYLVGPGGAPEGADAREVVVVCAQSRTRFVDKVPYITACGHRVTAVVSTMGVFEKQGQEEELRLTGYYPDVTSQPEDKTKRAQENCGWQLQIAPDVKEMPAPTADELAILRSLGPKRI